MAVFHIDMLSNALMRHNSITAIIPVERPDVTDFSVPRPETPFPTLYLLHGFRGNEMDWIYETRIVSLALQYRIAVIMPAMDNSFYYDDPTREQYYEKYLVKELIDFTRSVFPLSERWEDTALGGLSMGGYGALYQGLKHSNLFSGVFAFSPALIIEEISHMKPGERNAVCSWSYYNHVFGDLATLPNSERDPQEIIRRFSVLGQRIPQIYLACGTEDFLIESNRAMHHCLVDNGIPHRYREVPGTHEWRLWDQFVEECISWKFSAKEEMNGKNKAE